VLRNQPDALLEALNLTPYARDEFWQANEPAKDKVEQARRLCTRVMQGFGARLLRPYGGGFRRETRGDNYAGDWCAYVDQLEFIAARLRLVSIENIDALKLVQRMDGPDTLHYLDPPYLMDGGDGTYAFDMDYAQHEELLDLIQSLKGYVLLSGYETALYQEKLAGRWYLKQWRNHTDKHAIRTECLWLNERAARFWIDGIGAKVREEDKVLAPAPPPKRSVARVALTR
jgi:DNA adenine methylase